MNARPALLLAASLLLFGCVSAARSVAESPSEAVVRVRNAGTVPLRVRLCSDPCTAYEAIAAGASRSYRVDVSRLRRFVVTAKEDDKVVAQEPFTAHGTTISLAVEPPRIERISTDRGIALR